MRIVVRFKVIMRIVSWFVYDTVSFDSRRIVSLSFLLFYSVRFNKLFDSILSSADETIESKRSLNRIE